MRGASFVSSSRFMVLAVGLVLALAGQASAQVDLGDAGGFAMLGLEGAKLCMSHKLSGVTGDAGLGPLGIQNFSNGFITGTYYVDPTANNSHGNNVVIGGGTVVQDLTSAVNDALNAAADCQALAVTQPHFGNINGNATITGGAGVNVISVDNVTLAGGTKLTLSAPAGASFVVKVFGSIKLSHKLSEIALAGGLTADKVIFCFTTDGDALRISGGAHVAGTFLAPEGKVTLAPGYVMGAVIAGKEICMPSGGQITFVPRVVCPCTFPLAADKLLMQNYPYGNEVPSRVLNMGAGVATCAAGASAFGKPDGFAFTANEDVADGDFPLGAQLNYWVDAQARTCNAYGAGLDDGEDENSNQFITALPGGTFPDGVPRISNPPFPAEALSACQALLSSLCPP